MPVGDDWAAQFGPDESLARAAKAAYVDAGRPRRIAIAVSGGSDSLAVLHLMARLAAEENFSLFAVTVDHGLRPESAAEVDYVARICAGLGVPHQGLRWEHGAISGNVMDAARQARYALMAKWGAARGIFHILLGHTADDQAETFLMELSRSAGLDGLVGMRAHWDQGDVRFMRPFLMAGRAELRAFLTRHSVAWLDDPSNENDRYARVRARRAMAALAPLGITSATLGAVIAHLRMARNTVISATGKAAARICRQQAGALEFDLAQWRDTDDEVQRRLLTAALLWVSGQPYAPRGSAVARALAAIASGKGTTLSGCRLRVSPGCFHVFREPKALAGLSFAPGQLFDGRWRVEGPFVAGQDIRALGAAGLHQCKTWRKTGLTRDSLVVSPAIWYDEVLIAAPVAGFGGDWTARIVADFDLFVVSH